MKPQRKSFFRRIKIVMKSPFRRRIKKVITIPEDELTKKEDHYAINRIIKKFQKLSKRICANSSKVKLNLYCDFCRTFIIQAVHIQHAALHRPFLQIIIHVSRALKTITSLFIVITHFTYLQNYIAKLKMSIVSQTCLAIGKNFLKTSKKIVKMCVFLWNTTTEVQVKKYFYQYIQSKV